MGLSTWIQNDSNEVAMPLKPSQQILIKRAGKIHTVTRNSPANSGCSKTRGKDGDFFKFCELLFSRFLVSEQSSPEGAMAIALTETMTPRNTVRYGEVQ